MLSNVDSGLRQVPEGLVHNRLRLLSPALVHRLLLGARPALARGDLSIYTAFDRHFLGMYMIILLSLLSFSVKMTVLPRASPVAR